MAAYNNEQLEYNDQKPVYSGENRIYNDMVSSDAKLSETVRKYPLLYDKHNCDFHRKDMKTNAWIEVAEIVGLESGEAAEKVFTKLRDKYVRTKREYKYTEAIGGSKKVLERLSVNLEELNYLQWLDDYVRTRQSKVRKRYVEETEAEKDDSNGASNGAGYNQEPERDDFDRFGEVVARKMRRLSAMLDVDSIDDLEFEILSSIENAKKNSSAPSIKC